MRIVCISDTHQMHRSIAEIPECDLLIHAGDITGNGSISWIVKFDDWLGELKQCKYKVVIAGNHDKCFDPKKSSTTERIYATQALQNCIYLEDSGVEIEGLKIWGSPQSPWFCDWAFGPERGPEIKEYWDMIPRDTDILVTHGPPFGVGDRVWSNRNVKVLGPRVGCDDLLQAVKEVKPKLHVFGHIHEDAGVFSHNWDDGSSTLFVNAAICDGDYRPINKPVVVDL